MSSSGPMLYVACDFMKTGGMDRVAYALALRMAETGRPIHLVAHSCGQKLLAFPNVHFHQVKKPFNSTFLGSFLIHTTGHSVAKQITRQGGRVIVSGGNCLWNDVNFVHHVHAADNPPPAGGLKSRILQKIMLNKSRWEERWVVPKAKLAVVSCNMTKNELTSRIPIPPERVKVMYFGTDSALFHPLTADERAAARQTLGWKQDRIKIAFIGSMANRRKGFDTLYAAWKELCARPDWDADLIVVGRGKDQPIWKAQSEVDGLTDRISFLGFVDNLPQMLAACDAHCLPSRYEGYSLATQEALYCGVPALISAASGIAERYPPDLQDLIVKDPNDAPALAQQLSRWRAKMDWYRARVGEWGAELRTCTWEVMADQFMEIIGEGNAERGMRNSEEAGAKPYEPAVAPHAQG
jgi:glycosyltransferase involved in cell wall biosynthesis